MKGEGCAAADAENKASSRVGASESGGEAGDPPNGGAEGHERLWFGRRGYDPSVSTLQAGDITAGKTIAAKAVGAFAEDKDLAPAAFVLTQDVEHCFV